MNARDRAHLAVVAIMLDVSCGRERQRMMEDVVARAITEAMHFAYEDSAAIAETMGTNQKDVAGQIIANAIRERMQEMTK